MCLLVVLLLSDLLSQQTKVTRDEDVATARSPSRNQAVLKAFGPNARAPKAPITVLRLLLITLGPSAYGVILQGHLVTHRL